MEEQKKLIEKAASAAPSREPGQFCVAARQGAGRCGQHHADHSTDSRPLPRRPSAAGNTTPGNPCEGPPDTECGAALFAVRQRLHHPGRVCGRDVRVARQERGFGYRKQFRQRPLQQHGQRQPFRKPFSIQNSRLGLRVDGDWKGTHFIGYNEFDFLGTSGASNLNTTNGAVVPRLRLYWVDVRKGAGSFWPAKAGAC
jgi:hypothetical protein